MSEETNVQKLIEENSGLRERIEALRAGKNRLKEDLATAIEEWEKAEATRPIIMPFAHTKEAREEEESVDVPAVKPKVGLFGEATQMGVKSNLGKEVAPKAGLFGEATWPIVTPFTHSKEAFDAVRDGKDAIVNGQWITLSTFRRLEKRFAVVTKERDAAVSEVDELRKWKAFLEGGVAGLKYKLSAVTTERDVAVGVITANMVSQDEAYATLLGEKELLEEELKWSREDVEGLEGRINLMSLKATETMGEGDSDR